MRLPRLFSGLAVGCVFGLLSWLFFFLLKGGNAGWGVFLLLEPIVFYAALGGLLALLQNHLTERWYFFILVAGLTGVIKSFSQQLALPLFSFELWKQALPLTAETTIFGLFFFVIFSIQHAEPLSAGEKK